MRGGFQISIGMSPFANENDDGDQAPAHHVKDRSGDVQDFHRHSHNGHKSMAFHHVAAGQGDHEAAAKHHEEAQGHFQKAARIAADYEGDGDGE
jgi:hypothetical protein